MKKRTDFLKNFNLVPKLLCVLVAFVIWLYVAAVESPDHQETVYQVPVKLLGASTIESNHGLSVFSGYDLTVDLTVKGQMSTVNKYGVDDYYVTVDISKINEGGRYSVDLSFDMPRGVTLISASSETAELYIDERAQTTVKVEPEWTSVSVASNDYEVGELVPDFDTISVSGPKREIDEIDRAIVYISASNLSASKNIVGKLTLVNIAGVDIVNPYVKPSKTEMNVYVPVNSYKELKVDVPTKYGYYSDTNCEIIASPSTIVVKGDPGVLEKYSSIKTAVIDEKTILGDCEKTLSLQIPDNITLANGETNTVTVKIVHKGTTTKEFNIDDIEVEGAEHLEYAIQTSMLRVQLRGSARALSKIDKSAVSVTVDLSGITDASGIITVPVTIKVNSSDSSVYPIGEYSVEVKIS